MLKFTIVTPTYNQAKYLPDTLESVLRQASADQYAIEYFVFDACSTDGTVAILNEYKEKFLAAGIDYHFYSEPDKGQSDAINKGFKKATGDIITYINSDDTYTEHAIQAVNDFFSKQLSTLWAYGGWNIITDSGRVFLCHQPEPYNKRRLLSQCYIGQPSCFYRKELLQKVGLLNVDLHLAMDYDLWLRFAQEAPAGVIKAILSNLRFYENTKSALFINKVARISLNLSKQYSAPVSVERLLQYYNYWRIRLSQALHHDISTQVARFNRKTLN